MHGNAKRYVVVPLGMLGAFQIWMESSNFSPRARLSVEAVCKTWCHVLLQIVGGFLLKAPETPIHHNLVYNPKLSFSRLSKTNETIQNSSVRFYEYQQSNIL